MMRARVGRSYGFRATRIRAAPDAPPAAARECRSGRRCEMSAVSHEPTASAQANRRWSSQLRVREMWASLAIIVIWLSVLVDAIVGPDIVNTSAGGDTSTVPSAVAVALFAFLATWVVAKYGLREGHE
jgi:hypothetical protein